MPLSADLLKIAEKRSNEELIGFIRLANNSDNKITLPPFVS
jgi:hypothetical protein